jgi:hypothetical protein
MYTAKSLKSEKKKKKILFFSFFFNLSVIQKNLASLSQKSFVFFYLKNKNNKTSCNFKIKKRKTWVKKNV